MSATGLSLRLQAPADALTPSELTKASSLSNRATLAAAHSCPTTLCVALPSQPRLLSAGSCNFFERSGCRPAGGSSCTSGHPRARLLQKHDDDVYELPYDTNLDDICMCAGTSGPSCVTGRASCYCVLLPRRHFTLMLRIDSRGSALCKRGRAPVASCHHCFRFSCADATQLPEIACVKIV